MTNKEKQFLDLAVYAYLQSHYPNIDASPLLGRLTSAPKIGDNSPKLEEVFSVGLKTLYPDGLTPFIDNLKEDNIKISNNNDYDTLGNDKQFQKFLENVVSKGYFGEHQPGSEEYQNRFAKVVEKYRARFGENIKTNEVDNETKAEEFKKQGNDLLVKNDHAGAVKKYSEAIELNPHGKSAHIYYANRAAAYLHLNENENAIDDCELALALDSNYVKAHTRKAQAYFNLGRTDDAIDSARAALEIDPNNVAAKSILQQCDAEATVPIAEEDPSDMFRGMAMPGAAGGFPGMPGLGGMDFGAMMNNPMIQQMAQQMASNPDMLKNMMSSMGLGGGGGGGFPDLSKMMNNPNLKKMAEQVSKDPNMMSNLGNMMGGMKPPRRNDDEDPEAV